jgi:hypothetical protein
MNERKRTPSTDNLAAIEFGSEQSCDLCNQLTRRIIRDRRMPNAVFCADPHCTERREALSAEELASAARAS